MKEKLKDTSFNKECLKIAMIGHKRIPSREGGVEIVVEELSTRLVEIGHQVDAFNRKGHHVAGDEFDGEIIKNNVYKGIKIITIPTINIKGIAAFISSYLATFKALFKKYDIIHYHAEGICATIWLPHLFKKKTVVTIHGLDWQRSKWGGFAEKYLKFGEILAAKYADEIIVLSKNVQEYFKKEYNRETVFIPNGIFIPEKKNVSIIKKRWQLAKQNYILYLGRIVPEKGIDYLIEAYKEIDTDIKLVIAGGASDTDEYMARLQNKASVDNRIIFTGFVQGRDLEELYSNAYLYVLPSDLEGMPISLLEAMSYGNCCLVSDIPECTEVVEDKAFHFKKSDSLDLREKLQWLINNKETVEKYREKACEFICSKYNWDEIVKETEELYFKAKYSNVRKRYESQRSMGR